MFAWYADGLTLADTTRRANDADLPCRPPRKAWDRHAVQRILTNPVYVGRIRYNRRILDAQHEAIIPLALWRHVQGRRQQRRIPKRPGEPSLTPLLVCGVCLGRIGLRTNRHQLRRYRCDARLALPLDQRHEAVSATARTVDDAVWAWTRQLVTEHLFKEALRHYAQEQDADTDSEVAQLRERVAVLEEEISYNLGAARSGGLPLDLLAEQNAPLIQERDSLQGRLERQAAGTPLAQLEDLQRISEGGFEGLLRETDPHARRDFLALLYNGIELHKHRLVIQHRIAVPAQTVLLPRRYVPTKGPSQFEFA